MFQTITIPVGTTGYIPSNAKVITKISSGDAIATSTCMDLTGEDLNCYAFLTSSQNDTGGHHEPFQKDNIYYLGLVSQGKEYLFEEEIRFDDALPSNLKTAINALPGIGQLLIDVVTDSQDDGDYGVKHYIVFKSVASVAATLQLKMRTHLFFEGDSDFVYYTSVLDYNEVAENNDAVPACTANNVPQDPLPDGGEA